VERLDVEVAVAGAAAVVVGADVFAVRIVTVPGSVTRPPPSVWNGIRAGDCGGERIYIGGGVIAAVIIVLS